MISLLGRPFIGFNYQASVDAKCEDKRRFNAWAWTDLDSGACLASVNACAEVNCALEDLTGVTYNTSDQHKEATRARQERDFKYTEELLKCLQSRNPFTDDPCLRSISTGVTADNEVNVDKANEIESQILESMIGESILGYIFRRKQQVIIEVLPTVAYAHNTSRMCEDGTVMPLLYSMATKLEHQQRS